MTQLDNDSWERAFASFHDDVRSTLRVPAVAGVRAGAEVRRRRHRAAVSLAVAVAVVLVGTAAFGAVRRGAGPPTATPPTVSDSAPATGSPSAEPSRSSASPSGTSYSPVGPTARLTVIGHTHPVPGTVLLFAGDANSSTLVTISPDGTVRAIKPKVSDFLLLQQEFVVTANGERIASTVEESKPVKVMGADGSGVRQLPDAADPKCGAPVFSPDGSMLAYGLRDSRHTLVAVAVDGTHRRVVGTGCYPIFSADGSRIGYTTKDGKLGVVGVDGSDPRVIPIRKAGYELRSVTSLTATRAAVYLNYTAGCGCDDGYRTVVVTDLLDLATGAATAVGGDPTPYSAMFGADGVLLLSVEIHESTNKWHNELRFRRPDGSTATVLDLRTLTGTKNSMGLDLQHAVLWNYATIG